ncbi:MAG: bifunctional UDP-sugar hydrolase/5'-nucleotidase [Erysipelotrichaceae bacterium]|nr:bifunctional UDP-sugar hydrolase/5'-nucleotidase [Erysipelotrichaceae bacterium]
MDCRLIITTDTHGVISPLSYSDQQELPQGLAKLATIINKERNENTLVIDNGDALQGSPLLYHHYLFSKGDINPMAKVFNYLKYDYLNTGNHDFNFGSDAMLKFYRDNSAKWLTGNILKDDKAINPSYTIHKFKNQKSIALIGCVTQFIPNWEHPDHINGFRFINCLKFVKETIKTIKEKEKVDYIVCLYHGGIEKDMITGKPTELLSGENQGYAMCQEIEGLDLLITGHQHRSFVTKINNTTVTQCANDAKELVIIDLKDDGIKAQIVKAEVEIDHQVNQLIAEEEKATQSWLDVPLGRLIDGDLLINDMFEARLHKHPLVSFLNQVQSYTTNVDISCIGLANKVTGFKQEITMRDILSSYVYPNTLIVIELTGKKLRKALEKSAEYFTVIDNEITINPEFETPKPKHYNYDMFDGIEYTLKISNPINHRVIEAKYHNEDLDDDKLYQVALNNYRAVGGGDFNMYKGSKIIKDTQKHIVDCIADYIIHHQEIKVVHKDNIKIII